MVMRRVGPRKFECCICNDTIEGEYGNNPDPFYGGKNGKACDWCNENYVVQARLVMMTMTAEAREAVDRADSREALRLSKEARLAFLKKEAAEAGVDFYTEH
jgi:hypothetical protein